MLGVALFEHSIFLYLQIPPIFEVKKPSFLPQFMQFLDSIYFFFSVPCCIKKEFTYGRALLNEMIAPF